MFRRLGVRIPYGHFFTIICCKNCNVCLKKTKTNEKEATDGPFLKKNLSRIGHRSVGNLSNLV